MKTRQTQKKIIAILLSAALFVPFSNAFALERIDASFNPDLLIPDPAFADAGTFGSAEGVQQFLELKGSVLAKTSPDFLAKLKEPDKSTKMALEDPQPALSRLRTAAELIYDASMHWGLNPQVVLVLLQKEQSLITGTFSSSSSLQTALDHAVGFGCPDNAPCGDIFEGFYRQLFGSFDADGNRWLGAAASLMKSFRTEAGRGPMVDSQNQVFGTPKVRASHKGDTIILDNTLGGYQGVASTQSVTLSNFATAALYRYTPHVFNGNYNFWKFYTAWFKYPNGTIIQKIGDSVQYVIDNGTKRSFSSFVATQRKLNLSGVVAVSKTEFDSYATEKPLPPLDTTLIKGDQDATIYIIQYSAKHPISGPVFAQRRFSFAKVINLPQAEVDTYEQGAFLAPLDKTLVVGQNDATVYIIDGGFKRVVSAPIFKIRKFSFAKIMKLSDAEINSIPTGPFLTPPEQTAIKTANDATVWWFKDNLKHQVSAFVFKQRSVGYYPLIVLSDNEVMSIPTGAALAPKDGTVFKSDSSTAIYRMQSGVKHLLTYDEYKRLGYPKPTILSQTEIDLY